MYICICIILDIDFNDSIGAATRDKWLSRME